MSLENPLRHLAARILVEVHLPEEVASLIRTLILVFFKWSVRGAHAAAGTLAAAGEAALVL